jgi:hypothetical protein
MRTPSRWIAPRPVSRRVWLMAGSRNARFRLSSRPEGILEALDETLRCIHPLHRAWRDVGCTTLRRGICSSNLGKEGAGPE